MGMNTVKRGKGQQDIQVNERDIAVQCDQLQTQNARVIHQSCE